MEEDPEEDPDIESESHFGIEELCFFLIESGLPESAVYGWHSGWPMDRLERAFRYFKMREIENQRSFVTAISIGASTLFSTKAIEEYMRSTDRIISGTSSHHDREKAQKIAGEMSKLMGVLNG